MKVTDRFELILKARLAIGGAVVDILHPDAEPKSPSLPRPFLVSMRYNKIPRNEKVAEYLIVRL